MGPVGLIVKTKTVVIDKVLPNVMGAGGEGEEGEKGSYLENIQFLGWQSYVQWMPTNLSSSPQWNLPKFLNTHKQQEKETNKQKSLTYMVFTDRIWKVLCKR